MICGKNLTVLLEYIHFYGVPLIILAYYAGMVINVHNHGGESWAEKKCCAIYSYHNNLS